MACSSVIARPALHDESNPSSRSSAFTAPRLLSWLATQQDQGTPASRRSVSCPPNSAIRSNFPRARYVPQRSRTARSFRPVTSMPGPTDRASNSTSSRRASGAEHVYREFQRAPPERVPQPTLVPQRGRSPGCHCRLARRVQQNETAFQLRRPPARGVRSSMAGGRDAVTSTSEGAAKQVRLDQGWGAAQPQEAVSL